MATKHGAAPAGDRDAGPRPDLRGFRLAPTALIERPLEAVRRRAVAGLLGGFALALAVGWALPALGVRGGLVAIVGALTNLVAALAIPVLLLPSADRRLLAIMQRLATSTSTTWRRAHGRAALPKTEEQWLLWLAGRPPDTTDPDALDVEGGAFLMLGRYAEARERADRLPDSSPWWRFSKALAYAAIEFDSGAGPGDLSAARAAAETVHGERRGLVRATMALEEASRALVRGDDWGPAVAAAPDPSPVTWVYGMLLGALATRWLLPALIGSSLVLGTVLSLLQASPAP